MDTKGDPNSDDIKEINWMVDSWVQKVCERVSRLIGFIPPVDVVKERMPFLEKMFREVDA